MKGTDLTPYLIREAYGQGAFPMADEDTGDIEWYVPFRRAVFPLSGIHVSRSLARVIKSETYEIRFDTAFEQVMRLCLRPRHNWISEDMIRVYTVIHSEGWAHSAEAWHEGELVGGVYGIAIGSCFCAESMFHRMTNASKVALHALVEKCRKMGFTIFDAQVMNPHLASLGAYEVPNRAYVHQLTDALQNSTPWSERHSP